MLALAILGSVGEPGGNEALNSPEAAAKSPAQRRNSRRGSRAEPPTRGAKRRGVQVKDQRNVSRAERAERKRLKGEDMSWHDGKSMELLLRCFEKELALLLKIFFTDPDILSRRRSSYFRRNYFECGELRKECEAVLEDINAMAAPRVDEAFAKSGRGVDRSLIEQQLLRMEEQRGTLKLQWPAFWASLGDRVDYRRGFLGRSGKFGSGTAGAVRAALADWWYLDIYAWVVRAEQGISSPQMSRLLFDGKDDHVELKVSGIGRTGSIVLAETDGLEALAQMVDERLRSKSDGPPKHAQKPTPWTFRITDGVRRARAETLLKRVLEMEPDGGVQEAVPADRKSFLKSIQESASRNGGDVRWLNRLIQLKAELGLIPEQDLAGLEHERNLCLPFVRVACSSGEPEGDDWTEVLPSPCLVGSLPSPEDEPLLAHGESGKSIMELEFLEGGSMDKIGRVEVVARVTRNWRRPYGMMWRNSGPAWEMGNDSSQP